MMRLLSLVILLIISGTIHSQVHRARYHCTTKIDKGRMHDGLNTLYFDAHRALYVHDHWPEESTYSRRDNQISFYKGDSEGMCIYMDRSQDTMIWKTDYWGGTMTTYILMESMPEVEWELLEDTLSISGLSCKKALGVFGGRQYTVYYAPGIPVSFGPYKLHGAPGLIVWAHSRDGLVEYALMDVEFNYTEEDIIRPPVDGVYMTPKAYEEMLIAALIKVESSSTAISSSTLKDPSPNWGIEKDAYTTFSTYKQQRRMKKEIQAK